MATTTPSRISVSEYLHTSYHPDCDYVDGIIEERNLGELDHAELQRAFILYLLQHEREWNIRALPEIRVQAAPTHFRIADIAIVSVTAPREQIIHTPPLAVIEILSPEDRVPRYADRLDDYRVMGVKSIWVVDPAARKGFNCSNGEWIEAAHFAAPGSPVRIDLAAVFDLVDQDRAR
ncbi:MAG TPA: Uma2 family endonuclease [Silvibacterium sp.]|nr:Uma2 family endonuclease [Silvibacterium sp.]